MQWLGPTCWALQWAGPGWAGAVGLQGLLAAWRRSLCTEEETEAQGLAVTRLVRAGLDLNPSFPGQAALALQPVVKVGKVWESSVGAGPPLLKPGESGGQCVAPRGVEGLRLSRLRELFTTGPTRPG